MGDVKKPKWDKPADGNPSAGSYGLGATIPPDGYIDVGMTAYAKHNSDEVVIEITKVENKYDAEGTVKNIVPETRNKPKTDLEVGDRVSINRWDIGILIR